MNSIMKALSENPLQVALVENKDLHTQLAKANERVRELEVNHQLLVNKITPLLDMQEDGEYYERCHLAEEIYDYFVDSSPELTLNKFAIEKKIEVVNQVLGSDRFDFADRPLDFGIRVESIEIILRDLEIELNSEQLRKEQE